MARWHLAGIAENADHSSLTNTNWLTDDQSSEGIHSLPNSDELRPKDAMSAISWALAGSPSITRSRILSSHLRDTYSDQGPDIAPLEHAATLDHPVAAVDWRGNPLPLQRENVVRWQTEHDNGAAEDIYGLAVLGQPNVSRRNARTFRLTSTTNVPTAESWSAITDFQLTQDSPLGRSVDHEIVGATLVQDGGDARAARFPNIDGPGEGLPGCLAYTDVDLALRSGQDPFRFGGMGSFGNISGADLEDGITVQVFADTASSQNFELWLDIAGAAR